MNKLISTISFILLIITCFACPVCERNKPKILQGITHGTGPESNWQYVIVIVIAIIAILTLIYSVKWLIKPGEDNSDHIKYSFLKEE